MQVGSKYEWANCKQLNKRAFELAEQVLGAFVLALLVQKYLLTGTTVQILADSYQEHVPW